MNKIGNISCFILWVAIATGTLAGVCSADTCVPVDRESSIKKILQDHSGGKVLKVDERINDNGCPVLEIRILINGTVKAVVVAGNTAA